MKKSFIIATIAIVFFGSLFAFLYWTYVQNQRNIQPPTAQEHYYPTIAAISPTGSQLPPGEFTPTPFITNDGTVNVADLQFELPENWQHHYPCSLEGQICFISQDFQDQEVVTEQDETFITIAQGAAFTIEQRDLPTMLNLQDLCELPELEVSECDITAFKSYPAVQLAIGEPDRYLTRLYIETDHNLYVFNQYFIPTDTGAKQAIDQILDSLSFDSNA